MIIFVNMIIVCQKLLKNTKINGITLFPFIILKNKKDRENKTLINHEKIHLIQQIELLVLPFYLWYILEFYFWWFRLGNRYLAYRNISFEKEAYINENDLHYLKRRKMWNFFKFFGTK